MTEIDKAWMRGLLNEIGQTVLQPFLMLEHEYREEEELDCTIEVKLTKRPHFTRSKPVIASADITYSYGYIDWVLSWFEKAYIDLEEE